MYSYLLTTHSIIRWFVLIFIIYSIYRAFTGFIQNRSFSKLDNAFRHWTATTAHIQLMIGIILYTKSPIVKHFWSDSKTALQNLDLTFYGVIHFVLMLIAIVLLTIGSALAKRKSTDKEKFKTMLVWFSIVLIIIFIAIPWPFSPLSSRTYIRTF
ncbi:hypothetical protein [Flavivirga eckloniae]|uniref:Cytochrome B n=1 Tax=Flavivirga eckloniae TaxID=1803846 RepID=A0A2K9PTD4_9FLAO|nr:hypothetical protein [Flavivirga eckloniae]AUP80324.1 hypothetical protein C1H87_17055 [Flavivirga eckloniae]